MPLFKRFKVNFSLKQNKKEADEIPDIVNNEGEYRLYKGESISHGLDNITPTETSSMILPPKSVRIEVPIKPSKSTGDLTKLDNTTVDSDTQNQDTNDNVSDSLDTLETLTTRSFDSNVTNDKRTNKLSKQEEKQRKKHEKEEKKAQKKRELQQRKEEKAVKKEREKLIKRDKADAKKKPKGTEPNNPLAKNSNNSAELNLDSMPEISGPPPYSQPESMISLSLPSSSRDTGSQHDQQTNMR